MTARRPTETYPAATRQILPYISECLLLDPASTNDLVVTCRIEKRALISKLIAFDDGSTKRHFRIVHGTPRGAEIRRECNNYRG